MPDRAITKNAAAAVIGNVRLFMAFLSRNECCAVARHADGDGSRHGRPAANQHGALGLVPHKEG
jgi:hypothetical protein